MKKGLFLLLFLFILNLSIFAADNPDIEKEKTAIKQAALDYIEGWYEGSAERMARALHPDLVKRKVEVLPNGRNILRTVSANDMIEFTGAGFGKRSAKPDMKNEVIIYDIFENIASAKVISDEFIDYLHLAKNNGRWVIVNVLWDLKNKPVK